MKYCPVCIKSYADESLKFCLEDGSPLSTFGDRDPDTPTLVLGEQETVTNIQSPANWLQSHPVQVDAPPSQPANPNTLTAVTITVLAMIFLFGITGVIVWLYFQNKNEPAQSANPVNPSYRSSPPQTPLVKISPTPLSASPAVNNSATRTAGGEVVNEVSDKIYSWKAMAESRDLNSYMDSYADRVDYYRAKNASRDFVRHDKQRAFTSFDTIRINITNLRVTPDPGGESATAILDKEWDFSGAQKNISGKVQQQLQLIKLNGQWRIAGEKDLKIYYVNK